MDSETAIVLFNRDLRVDHHPALAEEGFMHNRARMTVASFLCKDPIAAAEAA